MLDSDLPGEQELVGDEDFRDAFDEDLLATLDIERWDTGHEWERAVARIQKEIASAVGQEDRIRAAIRSELLPLLGTRPGTPREAGVYQTHPKELTVVREALLFPGRVEAVGGTSVSYDSLPIGITQLGVAIVGYGGTSGTFAQRLFRKEMASKGGDAYAEALEFVIQRHERSSLGERDSLSKLVCRGIKSCAERRFLLDKAEAEWRIGQGNPCPRELLTGSGHMGLLEESLAVLRQLVDSHKQFVFVTSALGQRSLLTLGQALAGGEYVILSTIERESARIVAGSRYQGRYADKAAAFVKQCCPNILMGLFRVSDHSPPCLFYAHRERVHIAVRVALADSSFRPARGLPTLIDVADMTCRAAFGAEGFLGLVHGAYAQIGANPRYFSAREARRQAGGT